MADTPPIYIIKTVSDFLHVPEDRLGECLREFRIMLDMARPSAELLGHVADEMARQGELGQFKPGDVRFQLMDRFEWIDDGLNNVTLNIHSTPKAAAEDFARRDCQREARSP